MNIITYFKRLFCRHNYIIPAEYDDIEERERLIANIKSELGEGIEFIRPHRCTKCGKEKNIGSGIIY